MKSEFEFRLKKSTVKMALVIMLAITMCIGLLPASVFADEPAAESQEIWQLEETTSYEEYDDVDETIETTVLTAENKVAETQPMEIATTEPKITETTAVVEMETEEPKVSENENTFQPLEQNITAVLTLNENTAISIPNGETQYYSFTAPNSGRYKFIITEYDYTGDYHGIYGTLLDDEYVTISSFNRYSYFYGTETYKTINEMENGEICYVSAKSFDCDFSGIITVVEIGEYDYEGFDSGIIQICGYYGTDQEITIPSEIDGNEVYKINDSAFKGNTVITSVVIPESVGEIGYSAFSGCINLTKIALPERSLSIASYAFYNTGLKSITVPKKVTYIAEKAIGYGSDDAYNDVVVEGFVINGYTPSVAKAYAEMNGITFQSLGNDIAATLTLDEDTAINIPVGEIQYYLFTASKTGTYKFQITEDVEQPYIHQLDFELRNSNFDLINSGGDKYSGQIKIKTECEIEAGKTYYLSAEAVDYGFEGTVLVTELGDFDYEMFGSDTIQITGYYGTDKEVTIPSEIDGYKVVGIGHGAFMNNSDITGVVIPEGVTYIESQAFQDCENLTEVTLPMSLFSIGWEAFYNTGLKSITVPKNVEYINDKAIGYVSDDTVVEGFVVKGYTPSTAKAYAKDNGITFQSLGSIATETLTLDENTAVSIDVDETQYYSFTVPEAGVYKFQIAENAEQSCEHGLSITLRDSNLDSIDYHGYTSYGRITSEMVHGFEAGETCYVSAKATGSGFEGTVSVTETGDFDYMMYGSDTIRITRYYGTDKEVTIPSKIDGYQVVSIGDNIFCDNEDITSVVMSEGITEIGAYAFSNCEDLTEVTLPESLYYIGWHAFYNTGLKSITVPKNVTYIAEKAIGYGSDDAYNDVIVEGFVIKGYTPSTAKTYAGQNGITFESLGSIAETALKLDTPASVSVKNGVKSYFSFEPQKSGAYEFELMESSGHGTGYSYVNFSVMDEELISLGGYSRTSYETRTYADQKVHLEAGKTYYVCVWPQSADFNGTVSVSETDDYAFTVSNKTATLVAYLGTGTDLIIPASTEEGIPVTTIGGGLYIYNKENITSVTIPEGVTSIGYNAFQGCTNLTSVSLPDGLNTIENYAFCFTGLTTIEVPKSVMTIGTCSLGYENYNKTKDNFVIKGFEPSAAKGYADANFITFEKIGENATTAINVNEKTQVSLEKSSITYYTNKAGADGKYRIELLENEEHSNISHSLEVRVYNSDCSTCLGSFSQQAGIGYGGSVSGNGTGSVSGNGSKIGNGTSGTSMRIDVPVAVNMVKDETYCIVVIAEGDTFNGTIEVYPTSDFNYLVDLSDNTATITGYTGTDLDISIPEEIEGYAVTGIGYYSFYRNTTITSVNIPSKVKIIYPYAFNSCYGLSKVTIAEGVEKISNYAFYQTALDTVTVPSSVTYLGNKSIGYIIGYNAEQYTYGEMVKDGFIIKGTSDSAAEKYAAENSITFKDANDIEHVKAAEATCTEDGNIEYWYEKSSGKYFSDKNCTKEITQKETVIPKKGHSTTKTAAKAATCKETGNVAYWYCKDCKKYFSDKDGNTETTAEAVVVPIDKNNHVNKQHTNRKEATCTEDGNIEYWYCDDCGKYFSDEECTKEITQQATIIAKKGHSYEGVEPTWAWTGFTTAKATFKCKDCEHTEDVTARGTDITNEVTKAATCTVAGETTYTARVSFGGKEFTNDSVDKTQPAAKGHSMEKTEAKAATCKETGNVAYWYCKDCKKYFLDENGNTETTAEAVLTPIDQNNHVNKQHTERKEATCTEDGNIEYWYCEDCGKYFSDEECTKSISKEDTVITKTGHSMTKTAAKAATSTEKGNSEYYTCGNCHKYFADEAGNVEVSKDSWIISPVPMVDEPEKVVDAVATEEEKQAVEQGATLDVWATAEDVSETVSEDVKEKVEEKAEEKAEELGVEVVVAGYVDVNLFKQLSTVESKGDVNQVTATNQAITISIDVPEEILKSDPNGTKQYYIARLHDDECYLLPLNYDTVNKKFTFESDKFSTYAIVSEVHNLEETDAKDATCIAAGNKEYWRCTDKGCGKYFKDADGKEQYCENEWVIPVNPDNHDWSETTYEWNEDNSKCTATRTCKYDQTHVETIESTAVETSVAKEATCTETGDTKYTAKFDAQYAWATEQTKTVEGNIPAKNHSYGAAKFTWAADGSSCTAKHTCTASGCTAYEESDGTITSAVKTPATCEAKGTTTYTATFDKAWAQTQTKDIQNIPAKGHDWDNGTVTKQPTETEKGIKTYHCKNCSATKTEDIPTVPGSLKAGTYYIRTALSSGKVLDIEWGSTASGANLQIYDKNETDAQKFTVSYDSNGYATITNVKSGKALDVQWANACDGANVWQYDSNNSTAQKWKIEKNSDGSYTIKSALNEKYVLDIQYAGTANGTNIQIYSSNGTNAQKFYFDQISEEPQSELDGIYTINSSVNKNMVLDVEWGSVNSGANVQLYESNGTDAQSFKIKVDSDGYATITNVKSGKALDVQWGNAYNGANVWQYDSNNSTAQKWKIEKNSDGTYTIKSAINEKYVLDLCWGGTANGTNVQVYESNGTGAQKFYLTKIK